jgi:hypothetical protein
MRYSARKNKLDSQILHLTSNCRKHSACYLLMIVQVDVGLPTNLGKNGGLDSICISGNPAVEMQIS